MPAYAPTGGIAAFTEGACTTTITNSFLYNPRLQVCREMASTLGITPQSCTDATHVGNLMDFQYDFHVGNADNGNLYTAANNKDTSRTQTYTYDPLNRLLTAQTQGTLNSSGNIDCTIMVAGSPTQTKYWGESFAYDAWGNLTGKTSTLCNAENATLTVNAQNQLLSAGYNAAGDMISNGGATYTYNGDGEMVSAGGYRGRRAYLRSKNEYCSSRRRGRRRPDGRKQFDPEKLRPAAYVCEPDPRNTIYVRVDLASGTTRSIERPIITKYLELCFTLHRNWLIFDLANRFSWRYTKKECRLQEMNNARVVRASNSKIATVNLPIRCMIYMRLFTRSDMHPYSLNEPNRT